MCFVPLRDRVALDTCSVCGAPSALVALTSRTAATTAHGTSHRRGYGQSERDRNRSDRASRGNAARRQRELFALDASPRRGALREPRNGRLRAPLQKQPPSQRNSRSWRARGFETGRVRTRFPRVCRGCNVTAPPPVEGPWEALGQRALRGPRTHHGPQRRFFVTSAPQARPTGHRVRRATSAANRGNSRPSRASVGSRGRGRLLAEESAGPFLKHSLPPAIVEFAPTETNVTVPPANHGRRSRREGVRAPRESGPPTGPGSLTACETTARRLSLGRACAQAERMAGRETPPPRRADGRSEGARPRRERGAVWRTPRSLDCADSAMSPAPPLRAGRPASVS